ncbi:MAG: hypothetical protein JXA37_09270, partial [Chloroflexia bacterium]|nr:hypothetical protein [Chloroflexia bacterium]
MKPFCLLGLLGLLTGLFLAGGPETAGPRPAGTRAFTPNFSDRPYSATRQGTEQLSPIVQGEAWQIELVDS